MQRPPRPDLRTLDSILSPDVFLEICDWSAAGLSGCEIGGSDNDDTVAVLDPSILAGGRYRGSPCHTLDSKLRGGSYGIISVSVGGEVKGGIDMVRPFGARGFAAYGRDPLIDVDVEPLKSDWQNCAHGQPISPQPKIIGGLDGISSCQNVWFAVSAALLWLSNPSQSVHSSALLNMSEKVGGTGPLML